ncbi:MAG: hypothetical protein DWQ40_09185 [Actinobacteria bacterium]|nr:MAG: hypothetical protein DWQ40_09185 [Actinomycetota bacterium]
MTLLLIHALATWFMIGLIWTIQTVHYPLFALVGSGSFPSYEASHTRRMGWLLAIPAGVEVTTGAALVWVRPAPVSLDLVLVGGALLAVMWVITALIQVPLHRRLSSFWSTHEIGQLVRSNWIRTGGWSVRGLLVIAMLSAALTS